MLNTTGRTASPKQVKFSDRPDEIREYEIVSGDNRLSPVLPRMRKTLAPNMQIVTQERIISDVATAVARALYLEYELRVNAKRLGDMTRMTLTRDITAARR